MARPPEQLASQEPASTRVASDALRALAAAPGLSHRVELAPARAANGLLPERHRAELGIVLDRPVTANARLSLRNKSLEYLTAGVALAVPRLPPMARVVGDERVGVFLEPGRPDDVAHLLADLASDRTRLAGLRSRARAVALGRHNAGGQAASLAQAWGAA